MVVDGFGDRIGCNQKAENGSDFLVSDQIGQILVLPAADRTVARSNLARGANVFPSVIRAGLEEMTNCSQEFLR